KGADQRRLTGVIGTHEAYQFTWVQADMEVAEEDIVSGGTSVSCDEPRGGENRLPGSRVPAHMRIILLLMTTQITTGAPKRAVMALSGSICGPEGSCVRMSQRRTSMAPPRAALGTITRWSDVLISRRTRWGTARPTKAMGPQKAVTPPVRRLADKMIHVLDLFRFTPRLWA